MPNVEKILRERVEFQVESIDRMFLNLYPQSNGKKERYWRTLHGEALRPRTPLSVDDARWVVAAFVEHYNTVRLHSAN